MKSRCISGIFVVAASGMLAAQTPGRYDRAAEKTAAGTIKAVVALRADDGSVGVHIDLKTSEGMLDVRVAPALFIGQENFWFFAGEDIVVIGAPVAGGDAMLAKAIQKGSSVLTLRTADGEPKWAAKAEGIDGCGVNHLPMQRTTLH